MAPAAPTDPRLPGTTAGDVALAALVLLLAAVEVLTAVDPAVVGPAGRLAGTAALVGGSLSAIAQAATAWFRRRRPRAAYVALALIGTAQFVLIGIYPTYAWGVLAFAVARAPGRATAWVTVPAVLAAAAGSALVPQTPDDLVSRIAVAVALGLGILVFVVAGAVPGRMTRSAAERADRERRTQEAERRTAALTAERLRIAEEIGSGVLAGLHRLVKMPTATNADLRQLSEQSRTVLAAMRRVLGVLRTEPELAKAAPSQPVRRTVLPDRAGLLALAVALVPALVLTPIDGFDRALELVRLPTGLALLVVLAQFGTLAWWRTAPVAAALSWGVLAVAAGALGATNLLAIVAWPLLVWGAASRSSLRRSAVVVAVTTPMAVAGWLLDDTSSLRLSPTMTVLQYVWIAPLWIAGVLVRRNQLRLDRGRAEQAAVLDQEAVAQERLRVARDLHDVVAHHVSAIAVQAGAARVTPDDGVRGEALAHIAESAKQVTDALPELTQLTPDPHGVVLDADGLAHLLKPIRAARLPVEVEVLGTPAADPGDAELFAQRILTEALTNVLRHAGSSPTRVRIEHTSTSLSVEVTDSGSVEAHQPHRGGTGLGLVGMHERARLIGGSVTAGPAEPAGWTVLAQLPRTAVIPAEDGTTAGM